MKSIKDMVWSFSRLQSFDTCPYEWYLHYIEENESENGFFAEFGTLIHSGLQKIYEGSLSIWDAQQWYEDNFGKVVLHNAPPNNYVDIAEEYYNDGYNYFGNISQLDDKYEILGVEKDLSFNIKRKPFVGFIDLLLKDKNTGEIMICDHKTAKLKFKKNGEISKTDIEHFESFKRQLYLYSKPIIAEYKHVDYLAWNMVRMDKIIKIPFDKNEYESSLNWAIDKIKYISKEALWLPNKDEFYCRNLCGMREICEYNEWKTEYQQPSEGDFYSDMSNFEM